MIVQKNSLKGEVKAAMRGGPGSVTLTDLTGGTGTCKNCKMLCDVLIPPGAGIGYHQHLTETEYYIMLEGTAEVDDNGVKVNVGPGDVVITGDGASHSIMNTGSQPVRMTAIVVTYQ